MSKIGSSHGNHRQRMKAGPTGMGAARTHPMGHAHYLLDRIIPSAMVRHEHYDQRALQCVRCGNVPKQRALLDDTAEGYVCRAIGACAKRAKENDD